ncbi:MAG TPA: hypothetical protein VFD30_12890 [Terriglobia bacterium]|nr:hypothetical protein [Terriglobia bacterium]
MKKSQKSLACLTGYRATVITRANDGSGDRLPIGGRHALQAPLSVVSGIAGDYGIGNHDRQDGFCTLATDFHRLSLRPVGNGRVAAKRTCAGQAEVLLLFIQWSYCAASA